MKERMNVSSVIGTLSLNYEYENEYSCDFRTNEVSAALALHVGFRQRGCNILALLSIVFVPNANHDIPTGQVICIFFFRPYYTHFLAGISLFFKIATNPFEEIVLRTYPRSVHFLPDHSGGISVSSMCYGFSIFCPVSFTYHCCINFFSFCLSFFLVKLIFV